MSTRLQPGDRRILAVVRPDFPNCLAGVRWSCTACGDHFEAHTTRAVLYAHPEQTVPYAFMVCPECATVLTPLRLELDHYQLYAMRADHSPSDIGQTVANHVNIVLAMRTDPPSETVRLRAIDAHALAEQLHTQRLDLVRHLESMQVLAGVEVATTPVNLRHATT